MNWCGNRREDAAFATEPGTRCSIRQIHNTSDSDQFSAFSFALTAETFTKGRDFAAWIGLTPRQHSTAGKELGRTSKMRQRDLRRLLIIGAVAVVRWAVRRGTPEGSWPRWTMAKKPRMLVAVTLANRMAPVAWALLDSSHLILKVEFHAKTETRQADVVRLTRRQVAQFCRQPFELGAYLRRQVQ